MSKAKGLLIAILMMIVSIFGGCAQEYPPLEGELIEFNSYDVSVEGAQVPPSTDFYCAGKVNAEVEDQGYFFLELSLGCMYPESYDRLHKKYVRVSIGNEGGDVYVLKEIKGRKFFTEEYLCYFANKKRTFNHTEVVKVSTEILVGEEGWLTIGMFGYHTDTENGFAGALMSFHYQKEGRKLYFSKPTLNLDDILDLVQ